MILPSLSFGCVCAPVIQQAYKDLETQITSKLQIHQNELGNLQSNLRDNINNLNKQISEKKITNALKKEKDKREWIKAAMAERKDELKDDEVAALKQKLDENALDDAINILKKNAQEVEVDEEIKNTIGNLTLLDAATNRMYGNSLFCTKRRIIIERIKQ